MRIEIQVAAGGTPHGVLTVDGGPARPFRGWLQLLAVLAEVLPPPAQAGGWPPAPPPR